MATVANEKPNSSGDTFVTRHGQYTQAAGVESNDVDLAKLEAGQSQHARLERKLGWHEKFNVMRHNAGEAPTIVLAARLSLHGDEGDVLDKVHQELLRRIHLLLNHKDNGLLRASVHGSTTKKPRFRLESTIHAEQVLKRKSLQSGDAAEASLLEKLVQRELQDSGTGVHLEDALPKWSVSLYEVEERRDEALMALTIHHVIADGKGSQAILNTLLFGPTDDLVAGQVQAVQREEKGKHEIAPQSIPPSSNKTLPMNPPFFKLIIPLALAKYVMPHLAPVIPPPIRRTYTRKPAWPALRRKKNGKPSRNEPPVRWLDPKPPSGDEKRAGFRLVSFDSLDLVNDLKSNSKANGVKTIHPTLHATMIVALGVSLKVNSQTDDWVYASETPINHRTASLGHGDYTGNFMGVAWWRSEIHPSTSFWEVARDYARTVSDEKKRRDALISIGLLKYLKASPENKKVEAATTYDMIDAEPATGWEKWWYEKSAGRRPHRVSAGLSNLGVNDLSRPVLSQGEKSLVTAQQVGMLQCPSAIGPAIDVDVMGYRGGADTAAGGLSLFVSWRQGVFNPKLTNDFVDALNVAGRLVAEGAFAGDVTLQDAVALVCARLPSQ